MSTFKRFAYSLALTLIIPLAFTFAQTPQVSTVNVTPDEQKVRISAVGDALDMRVVVSSDSGDIVFEGAPAAGGALEWALVDAEGRRVPAGNYTLTITYRTSSGKSRQRVEQVLVTGEAGAAQEAPAPQEALAPTGSGTAGRVAKWTTSTALGNSVLTESAGRIGLGTASPAQLLHLSGASSRLRLQSTGGASLTTTEYVNNAGRVWQAGVGGSTAAGGVANKFFIYDQTANQYRIVIDTAGNFGVGTTAPTAKLTVNGGIQILGAGNGIRFADGSIQTKAIAGTINGTGTANRLAKFTGPNSFGNSSVTEVSGKVGIGTAAPVTALDVRGSLTLEAGGSPELYTSIAGSEQNRYLSLLNSLTVRSASGLKAGGVLVADDYGYAYPGKNDLIVKGNVGIGTPDPNAKLTVNGGVGTGTAIVGYSTGAGTGVYGSSTQGYGVSGTSFYSTLTPLAAGIFGQNTSGGYAGYFVGPVNVNGTFTNNSDRGMKANIAAVDARSILRKLVNVPVQAWNYKSEPETIRHLGPMAQDFRAAFGLGTDDKSISTVDSAGVALASIQALYQLMLEKERQIELLNVKLEEYAKEAESLRAKLRRLEQVLDKK